jgi:hypothetical protein
MGLAFAVGVGALGNGEPARPIPTTWPPALAFAPSAPPGLLWANAPSVAKGCWRAYNRLVLLANCTMAYMVMRTGIDPRDCYDLEWHKF